MIRPDNPADDLLFCMQPMLALFAICDDVFTEDDALSPEMRRTTLGRIYEEWKRCRKAIDPDFQVEDVLRPRGSGRVPTRRAGSRRRE